MNRAIKAALLSALLFPGLGHFFLKKYIAGTVLAGATFAGLYILVAQAVESALQITERIQNGEIPPDVVKLTKLVSEQSAGADVQLLNIATAVLIICWVAGIVDAYRIGCAQDKQPGSGTK